MPYVIETIEDLERILREKPEWRERIRALILTEELLRLPQKFDSFVEEEFKPLKNRFDSFVEEEFKPFRDRTEKRIDRLESRFESFVEEEFKPFKESMEARVGKLEQDMAVLKQDVEFLKKEVKVLKIDVASLRGDNFERKIREKVPAFLGRVIKRLRPIDSYALADLLEDAVESGLISEEEKDFAIRVDFAGKGKLKEKEVYIALEATLSLYPEDVEKVFKRAQILWRALSTETIPVVVFQSATELALKRAEELGVLAVKVEE